MINDPNSQQTIADALQAAATGEVEGSLLLGFVAVSEWLDKGGTRWLSMESGTGQGDDLPKWHMRGYLNEALNHWPEPEADEDEES